MIRKKSILMWSIGIATVAVGAWFSFDPISQPDSPGRSLRKIYSSDSPKGGIESKKARGEYFLRMLRDPATGTIPPEIRQLELAYARSLPRRIASKATDPLSGSTFTWEEVGPTDVGGRTRALAVSVADSNVIIAGGVSGGIWKSVNRGATWSLKTPMNTPLSVTWVAQDPRSGQTNTWYYCSGELSGSGSDFGSTANFFGSGIYKSTDNGETWLFLSSTVDTGPNQFNGPFDVISKVGVNPSNGDVYFASNGFGIFRSATGGASFTRVIGNDGGNEWSDFAVSSTGTVVAVLSESGFASSDSVGVYKSTNNCTTWTDITPATFPSASNRSVLALAPSNQDIAYVLTSTGTGKGSEVKLHKIIVSTGASTDLSANLPDFEAPTAGLVDTQGDYNMAIAVKPDSATFVLIGTTNLIRSTDGFATEPANKNKGWIGGYAHADNFTQFDNHHSDQHIIVFDPFKPNVVWSGHDGGISRTHAVTAEPVAWQDMNNGYNVTQFYTVALPRQAGFAQLTEVAGGTQDNGTPSFDYTNPAAGSDDISTGDGAFVYIGKDRVIASAQEGQAFRLDNSSRQDIAPPTSATGTPLFIHPFAVDPVTESTLYYPDNDVILRNTSLGTATRSTGWSTLSNIKAADARLITALTVTTSSPSNRLYFGASKGSGSLAPKVYKLDNASTATTGLVDISISGAPNGAYIHNIAVNPSNGNEILVVMSNYGIVGLYHSSDGGGNYTAVEGNLEGTTNNPGPSLRWAAILPRSSSTQYLIGTSVGLFSTITLNAAGTIWSQEGADEIGNTIVAALDARVSDGVVAAATHGRGIFIGTSTNPVGIDEAVTTNGRPKTLALNQNYPNPFNPETNIRYALPKAGPVRLAVYNIQGQEVITLVNGVQSPGTYEVLWNGRNAVGQQVASGVYLYRLTTSESRVSKRMTLLK